MGYWFDLPCGLNVAGIFTIEGKQMTFYWFQIFSSIAVFIVRQLAIWFAPDHLVFFDIKFADLTLYYLVLSWIYTVGFFVRSAIEKEKSKNIDLSNHEYDELLKRFNSEAHNYERKINSLKEENEKLQRRVRYLDGVEETFEAYKIQNRSAKEANQQALQSFL
jgi:hypothetical protein